MNVLNEHSRTPLSWFGGKSLMLDFLLPHFPTHVGYCEPFGGSAAALFAKPMSAIEVYNDLNRDVVHFFRVLKDPALGRRLHEMLRLTPNARQEHADCRSRYPSSDDVERARQFFVMTRQSFGAIFNHKPWGYQINSGNSSFHSAVELLPSASVRLKSVIIENLQFAELFKKYDDDNWLWYLDPPYVQSTRRAKSVYQCEMDDDEHRSLLDHAKSLKGMVVLSGYSSDLYDESLTDWRLVTTTVRCYSSPTSAGTGRLCKPKRTECLWLNPKASERLERNCSQSRTF